MKRLFIILIGAIFVLVMSETEQYFRTARAQTSEEESKTEVVNVGNKICPVSGEKIDEEKKLTYEYEGKIYNFCCKACVKDFKKDPQKYIEKLEAMEEETEEHEGHHHE